MSNQDTENASNFPRLGKTSPILSYFCVYNPSLGHSEENTKDQILYYTAKKVIPADVKIKQVGLAQALVSFTSTFSPSQPTQNVHSQKNRMVFLQPEPGFWMHMCIELGILRRQIKDSKGKEKLVTEYLDSQLNDKALEAVLKIGYEQFKLLNGTFSSIIEGPNPGQPTKQKTRLLMHAIEEFFSDWIWKWDFDRLDTMCFTAVFNGVPTQSVLRANYLRVHDLEESIKSEFEQHIHHVFVLNLEDGALVYRSPDLSIEDVCALRKYVLKRAENYDRTEKRKADLEITSKKDANNKMSGLKQFTKSLSQSHILSYFSSGGSKSTEITPTSKPASITESIHSSSALPSTTDIPTEPSSPSESVAPEPNERKGIYLTGLIESVAIGMNGEERPVTKSDLVRVHISSSPPNDAASQQDKLLYEYYLLVYKHKSGLVWTFLLPATSSSETVLSNPTFYTNLENYMSKKKVEQLTDALMDDIANMKEKDFDLEKQYKCFYYDNRTLNMKSTMTEPRAVLSKGSKDKKVMIKITNEMLLQLLEIREDFEKIPRTSELYTRSTANHWIAGNRLYNTLRSTEDQERNSDIIHNNRSSIDERSRDDDMEDFTEMYIIATKKDTSLAEVEETLAKMSKCLSNIMHVE